MRNGCEQEVAQKLAMLVLISIFSDERKNA
jgi:hypothetical protein